MPSSGGSAAPTEESAPPDMATTTRVSTGAFWRPRLLSAPRTGGARDVASIPNVLRPVWRIRSWIGLLARLTKVIAQFRRRRQFGIRSPAAHIDILAAGT